MAVCKLVHFITVLMFLFSEANSLAPRPGKSEKHFPKDTVDIRDVTESSAVMGWTLSKEGRHIDSIMISCRGKFHMLEFPVSKSKEQVSLKGLKPNTKYGCSLLVADRNTREEWTVIMEPIQFKTLQAVEGTTVPTTTNAKEKGSGFLATFKTMAAENLLLLLVSILAPILALALCIGGCIIFFKIRAYKRDKEEQKRLEQLTTARQGPRFKISTLPSKNAVKLADRMRTKYEVPGHLQTASNPTTPGEGDEKALTPREFNQTLMTMVFENKLSPDGQPSSFQNPTFEDVDGLSQSASCDSEGSLSSQTPLMTLSTPVLPVLTPDLPQWSKFAADPMAPKTRGYVSLSDLLPPIPPPSEGDIVA